jgi:hypothetical protein
MLHHWLILPNGTRVPVFVLNLVGMEQVLDRWAEGWPKMWG